MSNGRKIIICIIMFILVAIVSFFDAPLSLEDRSDLASIDNQSASLTDAGSFENNTSTAIPYKEEITELPQGTTTEEQIARDDEPFRDEIDENIEKIVSDMSVEELVGQMLFVKNTAEFNVSFLEKYPVGGIILYDADFVNNNPDNLKQQIASLQDKSKIPLLIGVDEEGGAVIRVSKYRKFADHKFLSPRDLYKQGGYDAILQDTYEKSDLLLSYGINLNFAPVCDLSYNRGDFMYLRAFGNNKEETAEYVSLLVKAMNEKKIGSVLKHFPGYGSNKDTHTAIVHDKRDYDTFVSEDFIPFIAGMESGANCILISHNIVECMDKDYPASISPEVHNILRFELGFDGVIITDDLMMSGVANYVKGSQVAVSAVLAGNDMILTKDYEEQFDAIIEAVNDDRIDVERLKDSVRRILKWKYMLNLTI